MVLKVAFPPAARLLEKPPNTRLSIPDTSFFFKSATHIPDREVAGSRVNIAGLVSRSQYLRILPPLNTTFLSADADLITSWFFFVPEFSASS